MKKAFTIAAVAALALGAAACHKSETTTTNVSAEDNMLVPADENAMGDMNASMGATDNMAMDNGAMADTNAAATTNAQ
ncbi:hypothetical protein [Sphingomonas sp. PR090111-T3T-6A]|uniref:hypothetical protein n=1 Tax=Sphingomonas sp. PR090111-T3T-6A TaxID=685778 RepID=UPI00036E1394|nr:hypothetical protein [Sphingomonas sp. PR090111-T3T-6A]